ncbi:MAG: CopG family transcriptional regulator [Chloroflexi bacterium]|nr:CopG family transcriptional regulator [Chloroflexota bacterium]
MRRTQIYLEPELTAALDQLAKQRGQSRAQVLREAAWRLLRDVGATEGDPLQGIVGLGNAGPGTAACDHDRILAASARRER